MIKLWNYSKTSNRGVKDFAVSGTFVILLHNLLIPVMQVPITYHNIYFKSFKCMVKSSMSYNNVLKILFYLIKSFSDIYSEK